MIDDKIIDFQKQNWSKMPNKTVTEGRPGNKAVTEAHPGLLDRYVIRDQKNSKFFFYFNVM